MFPETVPPLLMLVDNLPYLPFEAIKCSPQQDHLSSASLSRTVDLVCRFLAWDDGINFAQGTSSPATGH